MKETLACAIVGHLVGDYLLQNDWMALNKKKSAIPLVVHCALWTTAVCLFAGWNRLSIIGFLFATHAVQDSMDLIPKWMRLIGQQKFLEGPCAPWSGIVVDNVFHILTLWIIWRIFP